VGGGGCWGGAAVAAADDDVAAVAADDYVAAAAAAGAPFGMNSDPPRRRPPLLQPLPAHDDDAVDHVPGCPRPGWPIRRHPTPRHWPVCYAMPGSATRDLRDIWKDSAACLGICHCLQVVVCLWPPGCGLCEWEKCLALIVYRVASCQVSTTPRLNPQLSEM